MADKNNQQQSRSYDNSQISSNNHEQICSYNFHPVQMDLASDQFRVNKIGLLYSNSEYRKSGLQKT